MNTHSSRLERWLGSEQVENISSQMRGWYGPPVPIANIPGKVYACGDGDFCGPIKGGYYTNLFDFTTSKIKKAISNNFYTGFASLADLINQATTGGKKQQFIINKNNTGNGVASIAKTMWDSGAMPAAGGISTGPSGSSPDNTTIGGFLHQNAGGTDNLYFHSCSMSSDSGISCVMLYDRFFQVNHVFSNISQSVTGTPTRYQDATSIGNFITVHVTTALAAGTPTYSITYVDQNGNPAETTTSQTIVSGSIAKRFPFASTVGCGWYIPLNSNDTGVRKLVNSREGDSLTLNSTLASGAVDVVLGKPYVLIPAYQKSVVLIEGLGNLTYISPSSCLAMMELSKNNANAANFSGILTLISG